MFTVYCLVSIHTMACEASYVHHDPIIGCLPLLHGVLKPLEVSSVNCDIHDISPRSPRSRGSKNNYDDNLGGTRIIIATIISESGPDQRPDR